MYYLKKNLKDRHYLRILQLKMILFGLVAIKDLEWLLDHLITYWKIIATDMVLI